MAGAVENAERVYEITSNINLWFKLKQGASFTLADFPEIIPFRWEYFRDQWEFIRKNYIEKISGAENPNILVKHIKAMDEFIEAQRNSKTNPFSKRNALFAFYAIFESTLVTEYPLTQEENDLIINKQKEISRWTRDDFTNIRKSLALYRDQYTDMRGLNDAQYNKTFKRSSVSKQTNATNFDMNQLGNFNEAIKNIDFILANQFALSSSFIDPFIQARINANNPDIDIKTYSNGKLVKINYGQDLRGLARQYMGAEERWIEIAIANGLKPPYIDEVGEKIAMISNGSGNKLIIPDKDLTGKLNIDKVHVDQVIYIQSSSFTFPDQRVIINIEQVPISGNIIIEVNGESNLHQYKISSGAHIRAFKPNTVNSNFYVLIPDAELTDDNRPAEAPWFMKSTGEDLKRMKIDLALDANGDLSLGTTGDLNLSYGIENAVQAIKLKLGVQQGELFQHENFGLTTLLGKTNAKRSELRAIISDSVASLIQADPRFDRIETMDIQYSVTPEEREAPAGFFVNLTVKLAGSDTVIPISFRINA